MTELPFVSGDTENYLIECKQDLKDFLKETHKDKARKKQKYLANFFKRLSRDLLSDLETFDV